MKNGYKTQQDADEAQKFAEDSLAVARCRYASGLRNGNVDYVMLSKLSQKELATQLTVARSYATSRSTAPDELADWQDSFAAIEALVG
jgi:hypothetical protein